MLRFQIRLSLTRLLVALGLVLSSFATAVSPAAAACQAGMPGCLLPVPNAAPLSVAPEPPPQVAVVDDVDDGFGGNWLWIALVLVAAAAAAYFLFIDDDDEPVSP